MNPCEIVDKTIQGGKAHALPQRADGPDVDPAEGFCPQDEGCKKAGCCGKLFLTAFFHVDAVSSGLYLAFAEIQATAGWGKPQETRCRRADTVRVTGFYSG